MTILKRFSAYYSLLTLILINHTSIYLSICEHIYLCSQVNYPYSVTYSVTEFLMFTNLCQQTDTNDLSISGVPPTYLSANLWDGGSLNEYRFTAQSLLPLPQPPILKRISKMFQCHRRLLFLTAAISRNIVRRLSDSCSLCISSRIRSRNLCWHFIKSVISCTF